MSAFKSFTEKIQEKMRTDLLKIKAGLSEETENTKDMLVTYLRFSQGDATDEEMELANEQFRSFLKTVGLGALAVLPFAPVTIPTLVKLGRKLGIDIIPNSFKAKVKKK